MLKYIKYLTLFFLLYNIPLQSQSSEALLNKGFRYSYANKDSVYFYLGKAKTAALKNNELTLVFLAYNVESWSASYFGDQIKVKKNINDLDSIINLYKKNIDTLPNKNYYLNQTNYTKAQYYYEIKNYERCSFYASKIINQLNKLPDSIINNDFKKLIFESNNYLGLMNLSEEKFNSAKKYFYSNIRLIQNNTTFKRQLNNTYSHLAKCFALEKDYQKSNSYYIKTLPAYSGKRKNINKLITIYQSIISNHVSENNIDSAKFYSSKIKNTLPSNHKFWYRYHLSKSKIYQAQQNHHLAIKELEKVLALKKKQWQNAHFEIAETYNNLGKLNNNSNNYSLAITNFDTALNLLDNLPKSTINQTLAFKILKNKVESHNFLQDYINSLNTTQKAIAILDKLKPTFKTHKDKLFLIENTYSLFEKGIKACYKNYVKTQDKSYIEKAFEFSEKSKSVLLLESLLASKATDFANIPKNLIEKEQQLKVQITKLEKKISRKTTDKLKNELFQIKQQAISLTEEIEKNYPNYYNLKYNTQVSSIKKLQKDLTPQQLVVSYFYGNKNLYTIAISEDDTQFIQHQITQEFEDEIRSYQKMINNPKSDIFPLQKTANALFKNVLGKVKNIVTKKEIIIFPDGLLNYIPFGSLVNNKNNYLIENSSIRYSNSATLLAQLQEHYSNNNLLAFAPIFKGETVDVTNRSKLLPLPHNKKEIEQIAAFFKGKTFVNNQATLKNFNQNEAGFSIIHLATHAVFNDKNPEYSYLAFTAEKAQENLLYVSDIYNSKLNANLITLSACETGIGDLKRGEGFIGLSRSFYYAGAKSIASALWKINDASTATLMTNFYKNLSEGKEKSVALQEAKISFLNEHKNNALSHPYYWSGFVLSGNNDAVTATNYWLWVLVGIAILGLFFFLFRRKSV